MKLAWHIAKKDLRHLALPVAAWIAFVVATTIWFRLASPAARNEAGPGTVGWLASMGVWTRLLVAGQFLISYLLAGALVIEDPVVGTENFWVTRPIANARLLAGKLLAAALLFVVAPAVAFSVVWLASGFTLRETWLISCESAIGQSLVTLAALMVASLARNLVQFLLCTVGLIVGYFAWNFVVAIPADFSPASPANRSTGAWLLMQFALLTGMAVVLAQQYLTRRRPGTWVTIGVLLPLAVVLQDAWPYLLRGDRGARRPNEHVAHPEVSLSIERVYVRTYPHRRVSDPPVQAWLTLALSPAKTSDGEYYAPGAGVATVRWPNGPVAELGFRQGGWWGYDAAVQSLLGKAGPAMSWDVMGTANPSTLSPAPTGTATITGAIEVWRITPRTLGELPLRLGAEFSSGGTRTRIIAVESHSGWERVLVLEEHDSHLVTLDGLSPDSTQRLGLSRRKRDVFVLMNRAADRAEAIAYDEIGSVVMHPQVVGFRRIYVRSSSESGGEWRRDAMLVKVRLEREEEFVRAFEARETGESGDKKP